MPGEGLEESSEESSGARTCPSASRHARPPAPLTASQVAAAATPSNLALWIRMPMPALELLLLCPRTTCFAPPRLLRRDEYVVQQLQRTSHWERNVIRTHPFNTALPPLRLVQSTVQDPPHRAHPLADRLHPPSGCALSHSSTLQPERWPCPALNL